MSLGNTLYLLMCIGMFAAFGSVLAYETWQQSRRPAQPVQTRTPVGARPA